MENPVFYFDDKDVFDVLMSEKRRVSQDSLVRFLRRKGIIVSRTADRKSLCEYVATWFRYYQDLESLSLCEQRTRESARFATEEILPVPDNKDISSDKVQSAVQSLQSVISGQGQTLVMESTDGEGTMNLIWTRDVIDFSRTPLRQRVRRTDQIQIRRMGYGTVVLRTPVDEGCEPLREAFAKSLENTTNYKLKRSQIRIRENASPEERIHFFLNVMNGMPSFRPKTVTLLNLVSNDAESDDEGRDIEAEEQAKVDFQGLLQAKLKGGKLLETPEYADLKDRGFSPSEVRWWAEKNDGKALVLFWFGFSNAKEGTGFFCNVVSIRHWSAETGEIVKTGVKPNGVERNQCLSELEDSVRRVCVQQNKVTVNDFKNTDSLAVVATT